MTPQHRKTIYQLLLTMKMLESNAGKGLCQCLIEIYLRHRELPAMQLREFPEIAKYDRDQYHWFDNDQQRIDALQGAIEEVSEEIKRVQQQAVDKCRQGEVKAGFKTPEEIKAMALESISKMDATDAYKLGSYDGFIAAYTQAQNYLLKECSEERTTANGVGEGLLIGTLKAEVANYKALLAKMRGESKKPDIVFNADMDEKALFCAKNIYNQYSEEDAVNFIKEYAAQQCAIVAAEKDKEIDDAKVVADDWHTMYKAKEAECQRLREAITKVLVGDDEGFGFSHDRVKAILRKSLQPQAPKKGGKNEK